MSITNTWRVLWFHQTSHHNRVTIKVPLGTWKVLVEAHGSRVGFVHPDDGEIYFGPSRWYHIDTACKHVTRSQECHITEQVKSTCRERDQTRYGGYRWLDPGQVKYRETNGFSYGVYGSRDHKIHSLNVWESVWVPRSRCWLLIGEVSRSCPHYSRTIGVKHLR